MSQETIDKQVLEIQKDSADVLLPYKKHEDDAGYDLHAYLAKPLVIPPSERALISTGLRLALPRGHYGRVAPRSGLAVKKGIDVGAGVVDENYRGKLQVLLFNHGSEPFEVKNGDRIAQLIVTPYCSPQIKFVTDLSTTNRGRNGFGSSGIDALHQKKNE